MAASNGNRWTNPNFVPRSQRWADINPSGLIQAVRTDTNNPVVNGVSFGNNGTLLTGLAIRFVLRSTRWTTYRRSQRWSTMLKTRG